MPAIPNTLYTAEQVAQHDNMQSCWIIINDIVYDVTNFLWEHPGGAETILEWAGADATEAFESIGHSSGARLMLADYAIGRLNTGSVGA